MRVKIECLYSKPEPAIKSQIWNKLTDPAIATRLSLYDYAMLAKVFMQPFIPYHFELSEPFLEHFYDILPNLMTKLDRQRAEQFLTLVCPAKRASDFDKTEITRLLHDAKQPGNPLIQASFYIGFLEDQLHFIELR